MLELPEFRYYVKWFCSVSQNYWNRYDPFVMQNVNNITKINSSLNSELVFRSSHFSGYPKMRFPFFLHGSLHRLGYQHFVHVVSLNLTRECPRALLVPRRPPSRTQHKTQFLNLRGLWGLHFFRSLFFARNKDRAPWRIEESLATFFVVLKNLTNYVQNIVLDLNWQSNTLIDWICYLCKCWSCAQVADNILLPFLEIMVSPRIFIINLLFHTVYSLYN